MNQVILLKCGELVLKGLNRFKFEHKLILNIKERLNAIGSFKIYAIQSTIYIEPANHASVSQAVDALKKIFGIVVICRAYVCKKDIKDIMLKGKECLKDTLCSASSFKVEAKRSDKSFALNSPQICQEIGGFLHDEFPHLRPEMKKPDVLVQVEIRDEHAFIYADRITGMGGMPVGTNGKAMLLLSGGIDSPVAGFMIAKRGVELNAIHFFSYPYTSERAKTKVFDLCKILTGYAGRVNLNIVGFARIQQEIKEKCPNDLSTIIMRRFMMQISEKVAQDNNCGAIITGESLGQVASQTISAMHCTGSVCAMPILRPLISMDKEEIVKISRKIGTFDTSILPYEDCCTVFTPKHPVTNPRLAKVLDGEKNLSKDNLIQNALENIERIVI